MLAHSTANKLMNEIRNKTMTREEEIRNFVDKVFPIPPSYKGRKYEQALMATGFEAGAKWADANPVSQWISVEDDFPCNHEELAHSNYTDRVLVLSRNGYSEVAFMCIIEDVWEWNTLITVLYWMPIPKPPKK